MRKFFAFLSGAAVVTTPAMANRCYGIDGGIYCDRGCRIVNRWWQGGTEWFSWSCAPEPEVILAIAVIIVIAIIAVVGSIASSSSASTTALMQATDEADAEAAEAQRITDNLKSARAEADHFLETYRRR